MTKEREIEPARPRQNGSLITYVLAAVALVAMGIVSAVILEVLRPDRDNTAMVLTIFGLIVPTVFSLMAFLKARDTTVVAERTHDAVNGQMSEFRAAVERLAEVQANLAREEGRAEGKAIGTADANVRTDELAGGPTNPR